jgi:hypothetical protein
MLFTLQKSCFSALALPRKVLPPPQERWSILVARNHMTREGQVNQVTINAAHMRSSTHDKLCRCCFVLHSTRRKLVPLYRISIESSSRIHTLAVLAFLPTFPRLLTQILDIGPSFIQDSSVPLTPAPPTGRCRLVAGGNETLRSITESLLHGPETTVVGALNPCGFRLRGRGFPLRHKGQTCIS